MKILLGNPKIRVDKPYYQQIPTSSLPEKLLFKFATRLYSRSKVNFSIKDKYFFLLNKGVKSFWVPGLNLPLLAAYLPDDINVQIVDENVEKLEYDNSFDLVGLTAVTPSANRAYEIATEFRKRGTKVIMGGYHASFLPYEALEYVDSVVIGEADNLWEKILHDVRNNALKPIYRTDGQEKRLLNAPKARLDLLKHDRYLIPTITQTSRGCCFRCTFCSVTRFFNGKYRERPIDEVIEEIRTFKDQFVLFTDDNMFLNRRRAKEFFVKLKPLNIYWGSHCSIDIGYDDQLLDIAKKSGCLGFLIGFESISRDTINSFGKTPNKVEDYPELIRNIRSHNILVAGAFIFGADNDSKTIFQDTVEFCNKNKLDFITLNVLTPYPGTRLFDEFDNDKRIVTYDWDQYGVPGKSVFVPKNMTTEELEEGYFWTFHELYSMRSIANRCNKLDSKFLFRLLINLNYRRIVNSMPPGRNPAK